MIMVFDLLGYGRDSARTGRELARLHNVNMREVTKAVQLERKQGYPIAASTQDPKGYYIPDSDEEKADYIRSLDHRISETRHTRKAVLDSFKRH